MALSSCKIFSIIIIILINFNVYSGEHRINGSSNSAAKDPIKITKTSFCERVAGVIVSDLTLSEQMDRQTYLTYGIIFKKDFNRHIDYYSSNKYKNSNSKWIPLKERKLKRTKNGFPIVASATIEAIADGIKFDSIVTKINGKNTALMTDDEINDIEVPPIKKVIDQELEFIDPFLNEKKIVTVKKQRTGIRQLFIDISEDVIIDINSKNSQHTANIGVQIKYNMLAISYPIVRKIKEMFDVERKAYPASWPSGGFGCTFDENGFNKLGLYNPKIKLVNQLNHLSEFTGGSDYNLSYSPDGNVTITKKVNYKTATFKNNFKFQSFPFDSQELIYELFIVSNGFNRIPIPESGAYNFLHPIKKVDLNEWEHSGADYQVSRVFDTGYDHYLIAFKHIIERNYSYYISKIILPILIILFMSWSVFWINPKELESRLTVSIVCLLSLIAYTFVIDKDIPKLAYLTIMDYMVLVSYFFSVIPTLQTIFVHHYISKDNNKGIQDAIRYDKISRRFIPLSYVIIILIISSSIISTNTNTIKAISSFIK